MLGDDLFDVLGEDEGRVGAVCRVVHLAHSDEKKFKNKKWNPPNKTKQNKTITTTTTTAAAAAKKKKKKK